MRYYRPAVLAMFYNQSERYSIQTDEFEGRVRIREGDLKSRENTCDETYLNVCWQGAKRSRYIPKATKRAVINRYAEKTGERYDPKKHHIDHRWPHSRGGSNTEDNLRVVEKGKNLKKGAKRPKLRDMW